MIESQNITIDVATEETAPVLAGLLELYVEELSGIFAIQPGADGRFGYDRLPLYWSNPDTHFPFFIRIRGQAVGFALVTRGSPATDDPGDLDLAEFFVLPSQRRAGLGRRGAFLLWNRLPGHWVVRVSEANHGALRFWESAIREYAGSAVTVSAHQGRLHTFRVFAFGT
jgi:predicted acetyltransferase